MTDETEQQSEKKETIGDRIAWICAYRGITESELARRAGLTRNHLSSTIRSARDGDPKDLQSGNAAKVAKAGGVSLEWLITGDGSPVAANQDLPDDFAPPRFDALRNWKELLASAKLMKPHIPAWAWDAVARGNPALTATPTPAMIAGLAQVFFENLPPPKTTEKSNR